MVISILAVSLLNREYRKTKNLFKSTPLKRHSVKKSGLKFFNDSYEIVTKLLEVLFWLGWHFLISIFSCLVNKKIGGTNTIFHYFILKTFGKTQ
jgi:hypothetical protein